MHENNTATRPNRLPVTQVSLSFCMYCSEGSVPSAIQELPSCAKNKEYLACLEQILQISLCQTEHESKGTKA